MRATWSERSWHGSGCAAALGYEQRLAATAVAYAGILVLVMFAAACVRTPPMEHTLVSSPLQVVPCVLATVEADAVQAATAAVVLIAVQGRRGEQRNGVGFAVGDGSWLLTAAHVVDGARRIEVHGACGAATATLARRAPGGDAALLRLPWRLPALALAATEPPDGVPVVVVGDAGGLGRVELSDGVWHNAADGRGELSTWAAPGASGSPVLYGNKVVGMVVAGAATSVPRTLALKAERLLPWLQVALGGHVEPGPAQWPR